MVLKKHLTPLSKGGSVNVHKGKGGLQAPMPSRGQISNLAKGPMNTINDYAKATPVPQPAMDQASDMGDDLG